MVKVLLFVFSLDTFPYAGTTTTCESLYMGVPCVAMRGSVHAHNVGVSLLKTVGTYYSHERLVNCVKTSIRLMF